MKQLSESLACSGVLSFLRNDFTIESNHKDGSNDMSVGFNREWRALIVMRIRSLEIAKRHRLIVDKIGQAR